MTLADAMNFGDWAGAVQNIAAVAAIVGGAVWGYYKFVRGRTFHRRAELRVQGELVRHGGLTAVRVMPTLTNTGGSDIPLRAKIARVYAFTEDEVDSRGRPVWDEVASVPFFKDHEHVESEETIADDVLVAIPDQVFGASAAALKVSAFVFERRAKEGGIQWTASAIIPLDDERGGTAMTKPGDDRRENIPAQKEADERTIRRAEQDSEERQREASEEEIHQAEQDSKDD